MRPGEWKLHPKTVELIWKKFDQAEVDLFASQETSHSPLWFFPSTMRLYTLKWRVFTSWCKECHVDPVKCLIGSVLEFIQDCYSGGLSPSTLMVYVAAIVAYHVPLGGKSFGRNTLVSSFFRGTHFLCGMHYLFLCGMRYTACAILSSTLLGIGPGKNKLAMSSQSTRLLCPKSCPVV